MAEIGWPKVKPTIPGTVDERLQFVIHFLTDTCDAPITVYMDAFRDAFKHLVLEWFALDLQNTFVSYLRPGNYAIERRFRRHWGGGEKKKRATSWEKVWQVATFDPGEWLGEHLWGGDEVRARKVPPFAQWLWAFEGVIERLLYYFFVLDIVSTFLYEWCSSVAYSEYCAAQADAVFLGTCGPYPLLGIFDWDAVGALHPQKQRGIDFFNGFGVASSKGSGYACLSAIISMPDPAPPSAVVQCRIRCLLGPNAGRVQTVDTIILRNDTLELGVGVPISPGDLIITEIRVNAGMTLNEATVFYQQAAQYNP